MSGTAVEGKERRRRERDQVDLRTRTRLVLSAFRSRVHSYPLPIKSSIEKDEYRGIVGSLRQARHLEAALKHHAANRSLSSIRVDDPPTGKRENKDNTNWHRELKRSLGASAIKRLPPQAVLRTVPLLAFCFLGTGREKNLLVGPIPFFTGRIENHELNTASPMTLGPLRPFPPGREPHQKTEDPSTMH